MLVADLVSLGYVDNFVEILMELFMIELNLKNI